MLRILMSIHLSTITQVMTGQAPSTVECTLMLITRQLIDLTTVTITGKTTLLMSTMNMTSFHHLITLTPMTMSTPLPSSTS